MSKISVFLSPKKDKSGLQSVKIRYFFNKKYSHHAIGLKVSGENFDKDNGRIAKGKNIKRDNLIIKDKLGSAAEILRKYEFNRHTLTHDLFRQEFKNPESFRIFNEFVKEQIFLRKYDLTASSKAQHLSALNKLNEFNDNIAISELTPTLLKQFHRFLVKTYDNSPNTIYNNFKNLRVYANVGMKLKVMKTNAFDVYMAKKQNIRPECLERFEVEKLKNLYERNFLKGDDLKILRMFLFCTDTGLRISDVTTVKHDNLINNILSFIPKKVQRTTYKHVDIPLTYFANKLIYDTGKHAGLLFYDINHSKINKRLKYIYRIAGIEMKKRKLVFHTARHTFATMFLQSTKRANGILILQRLLGHSQINSTLKYSHVIKDDIINAIKDFENYKQKPRQ